MEAIVPPAMPIPSYEAMGAGGEFFRNVRTPDVAPTGFAGTNRGESCWNRPGRERTPGQQALREE